MTNPIFVYERSHEIRVEYSVVAAELEKYGWKLIASIEPRSYIKYLLEKYPALVQTFKER